MWTPAFDPVCDMILSVADTSGVGPAGSGEANGWSLVKVFDLAAVVLGSVVVIQAIGGILSALEVPSIHLNLGAPSGSGLSIHSGDFGIPTYLRIEYGTLWAGVTSGLLLLAALALHLDQVRQPDGCGFLILVPTQGCANGNRHPRTCTSRAAQ
jgi:hypothetical protein